MDLIPIVGPMLGKLVDLITIRYLLGVGLGPFLIVLSVGLTWKLLSWHRDETGPHKDFTVASLPGVIASVVIVVILLLGLALVMWGLFHK